MIPDALLEPGRYPHPVETVELVETLGAWVLLAGEHAYKIKKPVRLPFMDYGTLERRRAACEAELALNRRFAPQMYLDVLPITGTPRDPRWGGPGQAIEYAVHMRRFDEALRLDHVCGRGALTPGHLSALARRIAAFQASAPAAGAQSPWGRPEDTLALARDNLRALRAARIDARALAILSGWTEARFADLAPLMARRRTQGRVREGHGDLHLANLALIDGEPTPFDGIEFDPALRWQDSAGEVAFTWMDLLDHGQPGLANWWLCEWLDAAGDHEAALLLPFFAVYRALVRAKVAAMRSTQPGADRAAERAQARRYVALARRIAGLARGRRQLVITHGLSGSGKTWASSQWLLADPAGRRLRLRSDVERKRLHGLAAGAASGSAVGQGIYGPAANAATYEHLRLTAARWLAAGWSVAVDAAFLRRSERHAFAALAREQGGDFRILAPEAPLPELRARIAARRAQGSDASEATLAVLERQVGWLEPLDARERARVLP